MKNAKNNATTSFEQRIIEGMGHAIVTSFMASSTVDVNKVLEQYYQGCERCHMNKSCNKCQAYFFAKKVKNLCTT